MRRDVRVERHLIVAMATPPEPVPVARLVDRDAVNPRAKARLPPEPVNRAEHTQEDFLRQVERLVAIAQQVHGELDDHPLMLSDELRARHLVVQCAPLHERGFADADVGPTGRTRLFHDGVPAYLHHYTQLGHPTGAKVPGAIGIRSGTHDMFMRRAILAVGLLILAAVASVVGSQVLRDRDYRALLTRGDLALRTDQTLAAIEAYSGAAALRPDAMLPRLRRGEAYRRHGDIDAAIRDFRQASALDLAATRPREELGDALYQLQRYDGAVDAYQSALALDDRLARVEYKLALSRYRAGDLDDAIAQLTRMTAGSGTAEMQYLLGLALRDRGRTTDAQHAFEKAVAASPGLIAAREELAELYARQRRRSDALEQLQVLAGLDRAHVERQIVLALAQARAGHIETAVLTLGTALERTHDDPRVYRALGQVWLQDAEARGDEVSLNKALDALERAGLDASAPSETLTLFGRALLLAGQLARAEQLLEVATTRFPVDDAAFLYYAEAAERMNHLDAARQALIDFAVLQGDDGQAAARARHIASLSLRLNDPIAAGRWLQKAIDEGADPNDGELLSLRRRLQPPKAGASDR